MAAAGQSADAGIGHCWRIETEPRAHVAAYALAGRRYSDTVVLGAGTGQPPAPFPLDVDVDALGRR